MFSYACSVSKKVSLLSILFISQVALSDNSRLDNSVLKNGEEVPFEQSWEGTQPCLSLEEIENPGEGESSTIWKACTSKISIDCKGTEKPEKFFENANSTEANPIEPLWYPTECTIQTKVTLRSDNPFSRPITIDYEQTLPRKSGPHAVEIPFVRGENQTGKSYFLQFTVPSKWGVAPTLKAGFGFGNKPKELKYSGVTLKMTK
jgi:hypothetical protein